MVMHCCVGTVVTLLHKSAVVISSVTVNIHFVPKNGPLFYCPYLRKIITDFLNSFTSAFFPQFAIK